MTSVAFGTRSAVGMIGAGRSSECPRRTSPGSWCCVAPAQVRDHDAGVAAGGDVIHADALFTFAENLPRLRDFLMDTLERLPAEQGDCACGAVDSDTAASIELP